MNQTRSTRPAADEFNPYYIAYIKRVADGDIVEFLARQAEVSRKELGEVSEERANCRYADGKWTLKEVWGHVVDIERVFAYRAMRFGRGDDTSLAGVDQDVLARGVDLSGRSLESLAQEYVSVRQATIQLFDSFTATEICRTGVADDSSMSVRAIAWIIAGHEVHHLDVIRRLYLAPGA